MISTMSVQQYLSSVASAIGNLPVEDIEAAVARLFEVWRRGGTAFLIGNGGSAATASHMVNDFTKLTRCAGRRPFRALALTDSVPLMTAWANDEDYASIFSQQLKTFLDPRDVVVAISTSGESPNILRAVEYARQIGAVTVGLTGRSGGALGSLADVAIRVPSDDIGQQEDAHLVLCHVLSYALRQRIAEHAE